MGGEDIYGIFSSTSSRERLCVIILISFSFLFTVAQHDVLDKTCAPCHHSVHVVLYSSSIYKLKFLTTDYSQAITCKQGRVMNTKIANILFIKADLTLHPNPRATSTKLLSSIHTDLHTEDHQK